jgi:ABC-2 type transport system permease protein
VALALLVGTGLIAGTAAFLGAASQHTGIGYLTLLAAGLNVVPAAVLVLGLGTLAFGVRPRAVSTVAYGAIAWSFLVEIIGGLINASHWVLDTSLFHQLTAAPSIAPDWRAGAAMAGLGVLTAALGTVAFRYRDLAGE